MKARKNAFLTCAKPQAQSLVSQGQKQKKKEVSLEIGATAQL